MKGMISRTTTPIVRVKDLYNESKTWVIAKGAKNTYKWNQEINGVLFYASFSTVTTEHMCKVFGVVNAQKVVLSLRF